MKGRERKKPPVVLEMCMLIVTVVMGLSDVLCHGSYLCLSSLIVQDTEKIEFSYI